MDGEEDGEPHEDDDDQGEGDLVGAEEDGGPEEIEDELGGEEEGEAVFSEVFLVPDEGEAGADHEVEGGPDGAEEPVGWSTGWVVEGGEPVGDGTGGEEAAEAAEEEHG